MSASAPSRPSTIPRPVSKASSTQASPSSPASSTQDSSQSHPHEQLFTIPVIDLAAGDRAGLVAQVKAAAETVGFFQVVNHGVESEAVAGMLDVAARFFELPFAERARYMSPDVRAPVRYGTSFNQANDAVLCWRDFLKLSCAPPLRDVTPSWPD